MLFFDSTTLSCYFRCHRAGSQLKMSLSQNLKSLFLKNGMSWEDFLLLRNNDFKFWESDIFCDTL